MAIRSRRFLLRFALVAGTFLVFGAVAAWVLRDELRAHLPNSVRMVDRAADRLELFRGDRPHSRHRGSSTPPADLFTAGPRSVAELLPPLTPHEVRTFFPAVGTPLVQPDPHAYLVREPNLRIDQPFSEHPRGAFLMATDSLGLRRSSELAAERPALRILVTGDSHTDGVVFNRESLAGVLERRLSLELGEGQVEVLNAGVGGYTFINYLGALERLAHLEPHLVIVVVYGGNDFMDQARLERYLRGLDFPNEDRRSLRILMESGRRHAALVSQDFQQVIYFREQPQDQVLAANAAVEYLWRMKLRSAELGAEFLVAYLPPLSSGQPAPYRDVLLTAIERTGFEWTDVQVSDRIADRMLAGLERVGVRAVDLRDLIRYHPSPLYWFDDHHISVEGHRVIARRLYEELAGERDGPRLLPPPR
jgi:lysophospholipase L1-like esterase